MFWGFLASLILDAEKYSSCSKPQDMMGLGFGLRSCEKYKLRATSVRKLADTSPKRKVMQVHAVVRIRTLGSRLLLLVMNLM